MRFYCFTTPGLEEVSAGEIVGRLAGARVEQKRPGVVFFEYGGDPRLLLELGSTEDIFALIVRGEVGAQKREGLAQAEELVKGASLLDGAVEVYRRLKPKKAKRVTYRVVVQRRGGGQRYVRQDLQKRVARAVSERFLRWKWVDENGLVEIWVLQDREEFVCGLRLSDRTMRHRTYKRANIKASLRPIVARSMVLLSEPGDDDVFLDPMCGAGTILIERGDYGRYRQLLGGDISERALEAARTNIGPRYKPIEIRQWDATELPLPDGSVTRIACNLPFGKKIGSHQENRVLYGRFVGEAVRVLQDGGIMVLLTSEKRLLEQALAGHGRLEVERVYPIFVLGQKAFIFKVRLNGGGVR